jgi:hypothetical protein
MNALIIKSFLFSIVVVGLANLTIGTYFEGYEGILNAITLAEFSTPIDFSFFVSTWVFIFPLFSLFNKILATSFGYSWICTLINVFALGVISFSFATIFKRENIRWRYRFFMAILVGCIYIDNILYITNLRLSFFSLLAAYFLMYVITRYKLAKSYYFFVVLLLVIGVLTRLEIALLTAALLFLFTLLFHRPMWKFASVLLAVSAGGFLFYKIYQHYVFPDYEIVLQIEHEFEDNQSISPDDFTDARQRMMVNAMVNYIQDDDVFTLQDINRVVCATPLLAYMQSDKFWPVYSGKFRQLQQDFIPYIWLFLLCAVCGCFAALLFLKNNGFTLLHVLRLASVPAAMVAMVMVLNVLIICPHNFVVVMAMAVCLLSVVYVTVNYRHRLGLPFLLPVVVSLAICFSVRHLYYVYCQETIRNQKAEKVRHLLATLSQQQKTIVYASGGHYDNYPSRLFASSYRQKINHYYADFFLSRYPFFTQHGESFFGKDYSRMKGKLLRIADHPEVVYLSNDKINEFIAEYAFVMHQMKLTFVPLILPDLPTDLRPYHIYLNKD